MNITIVNRSSDQSISALDLRKIKQSNISNKTERTSLSIEISVPAFETSIALLSRSTYSSSTWASPT